MLLLLLGVSLAKRHKRCLQSVECVEGWAGQRVATESQIEA